MDSDYVTRLFKVNKTVNQMLADRGYTVSQKALQITLDEFKAAFNGARNDLTILTQKKDDSTEKIFVFFPENEKISIKEITTYGEKMHENNVGNGIIVVRNSITPLAKQALADLDPVFHLQYFEERELLVNITNHDLVPKHYVLTKEEKKALLERYRVKESQLPKILISDPIARYYGLRRGQVVKIVRPSETAGRYVTYRLAS